MQDFFVSTEGGLTQQKARTDEAFVVRRGQRKGGPVHRGIKVVLLPTSVDP